MLQRQSIKTSKAKQTGKTMINVLMISKDDHAGSGWRIKESVEELGGAKIHHVKLKNHPYGYNTDEVIKLKHHSRIDTLIKHSDIIHFKGDDPPSGLLRGYEPKRNRPKIITVGGSHFRRPEDDKRIITSLSRYSKSKYISELNERVAITPDLNYDWFRGEWIPAPIRIGENPKKDRSNKKVIRIGHSPSNRAKKGTDTIFLPTIEDLKLMGYNIELVMLENMLYKDCVAAKKDLDIFWDQSIVGAYGNSAIEAMAFGVPTVCRISDTSIKQAHGHLDDCPIVSFDNSVKSCTNAIAELIESDLNKVSEETYEWTKKMHSYETVGKRYQEKYEKMLS